MSEKSSNKREESMERYRVEPGRKLRLKEVNPNEDALFPEGKSAGKEELLKLNTRLEKLQELLYAEQKHRVLVVLQAMDTGGKDGIIRHVFEGVNPQGVRVASFKTPTPTELAHDYLWRIHPQTPGKGEMVIFNRSHYEDVLIVRVHGLVPKEVWAKRFDQINAFEKMLALEGTTILKFFLHIDKDEQKVRLEERRDDPEKRWKFNVGDLKERDLWNQYMKAYEEAISKTSTEWAPWYVVPANRKWYRNLVVGSVIIETLQRLNMAYPEADFDPKTIVIE
ncbi:MAG TPA: polyphosphate kinase 2 family protein [bacterium]|nr:polyphosphate kinase 2 family protein [bacterium]HPR87330.1 polyphosphate kinase 2 family protein [bacterium]